MDIETGESSWSSSPTPTLFEVGDDEENTQLKTSIQELHDSCNIQVSTTDQEPESPHSAFSKRTHPDPTQDGHPRIDNNTRVSHPNDFHVQTPAYGQTRSGMPSRDSQEAQSSDLEPNASLHVYEQTDIGQAQATPKMYVMWLGNQSRLGTLPRVHLVIIGLSSLLGFIMLGGFLLLGGPEGLGGLIMSTASSHFMTSRLCGLILGALALVLIFLTFTALYNKYWIEPLYLWLTLTICPTLLGLLTWMCYKINVNNFSLMWDISPIPQSFRGCESRVGPEQLSLFTEDIYKTQFARIVIIAANQTILYLGFDKELSISIQTNQKLCNQGFEGNADLYGLGIRAGIYLQWITSLLANNLLPGERKQLQNVYLVSSLAICIATIVSSFAVPCMFSIEIEILYWMYWGGVLCVCISSPNLLRLGSKSTWIGLDWITAIQFTMHILMVYHGIWFVWYAYDQFFSRMPCGTYHFFLVPFLDPSESYWILRDYLTLLISPIATPLVFAIPLTIFLLVSEIKNSIQDSATYRTFSPKSTNPVDRSDTVLSNPTIQLSLKLRILLRLRRIYRGIRRRYGTLRTAFGLPSHGMRGIRLVTPVDIRDRRCVSFPNF